MVLFHIKIRRYPRDANTDRLLVTVSSKEGFLYNFEKEASNSISTRDALTSEAARVLEEYRKWCGTEEEFDIEVAV